MNELETQIVDISEDALNDLFNDTPANKTVTADNLVGGKQTDTEDEEEEVVETKKKTTKKEVPALKVNEQTIEDIDIENFNDDEEIEEEDEEEEEVEEKAKKAAKRATVAKTTEEEARTESPEVGSVLKSTVEYLIQSGLWEDFEGREELDVTEETYAKLVAEQDKRRVQGMFEELVDSTGPFGKAIIDYVKNGGNPDEIIDLFKEQKQVESINIEQADGQKDLVKHYYTEVMGWKPEKAEKYISNLMMQNELENEAQEVQELFKSYYKKEADRLNKEREDFAEKQKEAEIAFETNIKTAIKDRKDLTPGEKKTIEDYLLTYDQRLPNGNMVNKFYVNFAKMQQNPQDYIDLVAFVMDKQKFLQKVSTTEKTKATAEAFKFIKGNGAVSSKKGTGYEQTKKNEKVSSFDWGFSKK